MRRKTVGSPEMVGDPEAAAKMQPRHRASPSQRGSSQRGSSQRGSSQRESSQCGPSQWGSSQWGFSQRGSGRAEPTRPTTISPHKQLFGRHREVVPAGSRTGWARARPFGASQRRTRWLSRNRQVTRSGKADAEEVPLAADCACLRHRCFGRGDMGPRLPSHRHSRRRAVTGWQPRLPGPPGRHHLVDRGQVGARRRPLEDGQPARN